jgi:hypothetical protein
MSARVRALVDSGCSSTTFPAEWAAELGIDWDECTPVQGITASGADDPSDDSRWPRVWPPGVDAVFAGKRIHLSAMFRLDLIPILLGRDDFFAHYKILFDHRNHKFSLEAYNK